MVGPFNNQMVIHWRIFVGQARVTLRKRTQGSNVLVIFLSTIFRIRMDVQNLTEGT